VTRATHSATYEDVLALPDHVIGPIVDGELVARPWPAIRHVRVATTLGSQLMGAFDRSDSDAWLILKAPAVHLADVLVPDIVGWRRERLPELPDEPYLTLAPEWVCEVLSPSTASLDRVRKLRVYAREGVAWYWLVDPAARTLEVLRLGDDGAYVVDATFEGTEPVRGRPFEVVEVRPWRD
jgi:Uma2 family endonuclease